MRLILYAVPLAFLLWLAAAALVTFLRFLLARPLLTAVVFATVLVGGYAWCYARKGELS